MILNWDLQSTNHRNWLTLDIWSLSTPRDDKSEDSELSDATGKMNAYLRDLCWALNFCDYLHRSPCPVSYFAL